MTDRTLSVFAVVFPEEGMARAVSQHRGSQRMPGGAGRAPAQLTSHGRALPLVAWT